jgi:spoIIIJ-associated protein
MAKKEEKIEEAGQRMPFAKEEKIINETANSLFKALSITAEFEIQNHDEGVELLLNSEENGILIGYHGEVLEALQLILSLALSKKLGYFLRISIEIGEYKKNRSSYLENMAYSAKQRALEQGGEVPLPNLKAWERRVVHMLFQNDEEVMSESVGEGRERTLVIKPR